MDGTRRWGGHFLGGLVVGVAIDLPGVWFLAALKYPIDELAEVVSIEYLSGTLSTPVRRFST
jgi:hypothetical protein